MKTAEHQILTRIGFAERWLQRAREDCLNGDVARGLLTLVLADAEVRRVLQLAVAPARRSRPPLIPVVAVVAGFVIAAAVAVPLGVLALGAAPTESIGLVPGLVLRQGTGALLEPLETTGPGEPTRTVEVQTMPVPVQRGPVRRSAGSSSPAPSQQAAMPVVPVRQAVPSSAPVASPPPTAPAPVPAVAPAPAPPAALSGVDLLDLVIVADRTLRRSQP